MKKQELHKHIKDSTKDTLTRLVELSQGGQVPGNVTDDGRLAPPDDPPYDALQGWMRSADYDGEPYFRLHKDARQELLRFLRGLKSD